LSVNVASIQSIGPTQQGVAPRPPGGSFGDVLAAAIDDAAVALERADGEAGTMAMGAGSVADASIARAKADVALEVAAVAASRISGALNALAQTQV
jgi:flagellar hook-basal body complex protein FliE